MRNLLPTTLIPLLADPLAINDVADVVSMEMFPLCTPWNDAAFKTMVERVGWQNLSEFHQSMVLQRAVFSGDHEERLRYLLEHGLGRHTKIEGRSMEEYARGLIPFESIKVPRALKCYELLKTQDTTR